VFSMTLTAHIAGAPVEELLLQIACGGGALCVAARGWLHAQQGRTHQRSRSRQERRQP
jgi:hypothetical protein